MRGFRTRSLAFRLVAGAAISLAVGLAVAAFILSLLFRDYVARSFDARLDLTLDNLIAASELNEKGRVELVRNLSNPLFDQPYSGWYWQISDNKGVLLRSRSLWDSDLAAAPADKRPDKDGINLYQAAGPERRPVRVLSQTIKLTGSARTFVFAVAGDPQEIEEEAAEFNFILALSLGVLGLVLVIAGFVQVRFGLMPLRRIPPALADIRSGRAERLEGEFSAEVTPLATELNALLDHNKEVVERARTHVGNLAHALKTPLAVLANESASGKGRLAATVRRQTETMREQVEHHLSRARAAARASALGSVTPVMPVLNDLRRALTAIHAEREIAIEISGDEGAVFRGERRDLEEMLGNLMDNGCKWAKGTLTVQAMRDEDLIVVRIEDDGPGLTATQRKAVLKRGHRIDEAQPGSGLGLAIVSDIAGLYGGELKLRKSPEGGLSATLRLPAAEG